MTSFNALDPAQKTLNVPQNGLAPDEGTNEKSSETVLSTFESLNDQEAAESLGQRQVEPLKLIPLEGKATIDKVFEQVIGCRYKPGQNVVDDFIYQFFTDVAYGHDISNLQPRIDQIRQLHPDNQKALFYAAFELSKDEGIVGDQNLLVSLKEEVRDLKFDLTKEKDPASFVRVAANPRYARYTVFGRVALVMGLVSCVPWAAFSLTEKVFPIPSYEDCIKLMGNNYNQHTCFAKRYDSFAKRYDSSMEKRVFLSLILAAGGLTFVYLYPPLKEQEKINQSIVKAFDDSIQRLLANQEIEKAVAFCEKHYSVISDSQIKQVGKMAWNKGLHSLVVKVAKATASKGYWMNDTNAWKFLDFIQE